MIMKKFRFPFLFVIVLAFVGQGCEKWRDNRDPQTAVDNALAESSFNDVIRILISESKEYEGFPSNADTCSTLTATTTSGGYPVTIRVDFGTTSCATNYNFDRKGVMNVEISQPFSTEDAQATVTFEDFYVHEYKVEGTVTLTNLGLMNNVTNYRVVISDGKVTSPTDEVISWNADLNYERSYGQESPDFVWDDIYSVTGEAAGVSVDGRSFTTTIKEALSFEMVCRWISKGKSEVSPEELKTITVNYGSGNCDNDAEAEVGKKEYSLKLK